MINLENLPSVGTDPDRMFTHRFKGFGIHDSECLVEMWNLPNGKILVVLNDTGKGTSVTNASEQIITELYNQYLEKWGYRPQECFFTETYDKYKEGIDLIIPEWTKDPYGRWKVGDVEWRHIGKLVSNNQNKKQ